MPPVSENMMNLPPDNDKRNAEWIGSVYAVVETALGGEPNQQGRERHYGGARFIAAADYKPVGEYGGMLFSIQRDDLLGHPTTQVHTLDGTQSLRPRSRRT
jgi:hypothetical protein